MPNFPRLVSTPVDYVPLRSTRFVLRLTLFVLVTAMNGAVILYTAPILYRVSAHHPLVGRCQPSVWKFAPVALTRLANRTTRTVR